MHEAIEAAFSRFHRAVSDYRAGRKNLDDVRRNGYRLYGMAEMLAILTDSRMMNRNDPCKPVPATVSERVMRRNYSWGAQMEALRAEFLLPPLDK
jgi:hypothetical protein